MKRDNDLIRDFLFECEAEEDWLISEPKDRKRQGHGCLHLDAGSVTEVGRCTCRLTNAGHDYLEAVRDNGIGHKTKEAVTETGGNATLEILKELATGFLNNKISKHTGIDL